jgi:hypothetical protein
MVVKYCDASCLFSPPPPPPVSFVTNVQSDAGTDAYVSFSIHGANGRALGPLDFKRSLNNRDKFESGRTDSWRFASADPLGALERCDVAVKGIGGFGMHLPCSWRLREVGGGGGVLMRWQVVVLNERSGEKTRFPCHMRLSNDRAAQLQPEGGGREHRILISGDGDAFDCTLELFFSSGEADKVTLKAGNRTSFKEQKEGGNESEHFLCFARRPLGELKSVKFSAERKYIHRAVIENVFFKDRAVVPVKTLVKGAGTFPPAPDDSAYTLRVAAGDPPPSGTLTAVATDGQGGSVETRFDMGARFASSRTLVRTPYFKTTKIQPISDPP